MILIIIIIAVNPYPQMNFFLYFRNAINKKYNNNMHFPRYF